MDGRLRNRIAGAPTFGRSFEKGKLGGFNVCKNSAGDGKVVKDAIIDLGNDVIADGEDSAEGILIDVDARKEGGRVDVEQKDSTVRY